MRKLIFRGDRQGRPTHGRAGVIGLALLLAVAVQARTACAEEAAQTEAPEETTGTAASETVAQTEAETAVSGETAQTQGSTWQETYTYLSDTGEPRQIPDAVEKDGIRYTLADVSYSVEPVTKQYVQVSDTMLASAEYTAPQDMDIGGLHYALADSAKEEWQETDRTRNVSETRTYLYGEEIPDTIDVESSDTFTGETIYGTLTRISTVEDGAAWREGCLSKNVQYVWSGETWSVDVNGEMFYATGDSPWFEGCEQKLLEYLDINTTFNRITGVAYEGDTWQDENGVTRINVRVTGDCVLWRYAASYSGDIAESDLTLAHYINTYQSDAVGYLVTALATYSMDNTSGGTEETIQAALDAISLIQSDLNVAQSELLNRAQELKAGQEELTATLQSQADIQQSYVQTDSLEVVYCIASLVVSGISMILIIWLLVLYLIRKKAGAWR